MWRKWQRTWPRLSAQFVRPNTLFHRHCLMAFCCVLNSAGDLQLVHCVHSVMTQGSANGGYLDAIPAMASAHTSSWNLNGQLIHRISWFPFFMGAWCITLRVMGTYCAYNGRVDSLCLTFCRLALRPKSPVWAGEIDVASWSDGINVTNGVGGAGRDPGSVCAWVGVVEVVFGMGDVVHCVPAPSAQMYPLCPSLPVPDCPSPVCP